MRILITGSTGFVGSSLVFHLKDKWHQVWRLVRPKSPLRENARIEWDPVQGLLNKATVEGFDAVINLAGENIASGRWTQVKKARIRESRILTTRFFCETLAQLAQPPKVLINASAVGYYGNRDDEILTEESSPGSDFLAQVCQEWETATLPAKRKGIRVINLRFGMILGASGGTLAKMFPAFKLGLGGRLGSGTQFMSWVALDEVLSVIDHILGNENLQGPVNVVSPNPMTNIQFTKTLGRVLNRPTILSVPAFALKVLFGEMAEALLLSSARAAPKKLLEAGYQFQYPLLEDALRHILK